MEIEMTKKALSPRAQKLYASVCSGKFYPVHGKNIPKCMDELIAAGLVVPGGRVASIILAYVPKGTKPYKIEQYPKSVSGV
jgi:hypothetical protein